jgi:protein phosphatase 1 regulatory subunit 3A/B/C/D/E
LFSAFRQKIDKEFVAVENVLVKNDHCLLIGTIKVKNVCFEKEVFVRFTDNEWKSYFDRPCKFASTKQQGNVDSYDTFQFEFEIPCDDNQHQRMEFCVCYKTGNGLEFWDNNDGKNFEIISEHLRLQRCQTQQPTTTSANNDNDKKKRKEKPGDAMALNCPVWTEFASWSDLGNGEEQYW